MNSEATAIIEAVRAIMLLAATFGFALNPDQQAAIIAAAGAIIIALSAVLAWLNRSKVFSAATTQAIADAATHLPAGTAVDIGKPPEGPFDSFP